MQDPGVRGTACESDLPRRTWGLTQQTAALLHVSSSNAHPMPAFSGQDQPAASPCGYRSMKNPPPHLPCIPLAFSAEPAAGARKLLI